MIRRAFPKNSDGGGRLVLTLSLGETVYLSAGSEIAEVTYVAKRGLQVRIAFKAPKSIKIDRKPLEET